MRPVIFLYTDDAQLDDDVRAKMIEAGYLPVKVADVDGVRMLPTSVSVDTSEVSAITAAALDAIIKSAESTTTWAASFGANVARNLRAAKK